MTHITIFTSSSYKSNLAGTLIILPDLVLEITLSSLTVSTDKLVSSSHEFPLTSGLL